MSFTTSYSNLKAFFKCRPPAGVGVVGRGVSENFCSPDLDHILETVNLIFFCKYTQVEVCTIGVLGGDYSYVSLDSIIESNHHN